MLELVAAFICLTTLLTYVNFRFIGLPPTIGVMVTALLFSLILQGLSFIGYPGLEERVQQLIGPLFQLGRWSFPELGFDPGRWIAETSP